MRELKKPHFSMAGWGLFLAGALTLSSCSNEDLPGGEEQGPAIEFGEVKTRAEVTEAGQIKEFSVFAEQNYLNEDNSESLDFISLLENERVYRTGDNQDGDFTYNNKRYWVYDRTFNFFAVHPYMETGITKTSFQQNNNSYDGFSIAFETPATADTDLMAGYKTERTITGETLPSSVDMEFKHLLAKINIKVAKNTQNEDNKVIVKSISLGGVWRTGTFSTSRFADYKDNWDFYGSGVMTITKTEGWTLDTNGVETMGNGLLLMPQSIELNTMPITITYEYYSNASDTTPQKTSTVQAFLTAGEWKAGTQYSYNIVLAAEDNNIKFTTPTVAPWGAPQSAGTIIIN